MPWFKVDDGLPASRKVLAIPRRDRMAAIGLWTIAGAWCADQLTDGHVPANMVLELGGTQRLAERLVEVGLWSRSPRGGFEYHDWPDYQPTAEQVRSERAAAAERQRRARDKARTSRRDSSVSHGVSHSEVTPGVTVPPTRPDPTRPSEVRPSAAARDLTAPERQQRIDEACRQVATRRAAQRTDVGPGWTPAAARGLATDHHQTLHAHLVEHPDATVDELAALVDPPRPEPVNTSSLLRPVHEVLADRPARDDEVNRAGMAQAKHALRPTREAG